MYSTTYLKDYRPTNFNIVNVELDFEIRNEYVQVTNTMSFKRKDKGSLILDGDELELIDIYIDDKKLLTHEYKLTENELILEKLQNEFKLKIITRIYPQNNTKLAGLFKTNSIMCTQCEAHGFRRITYYYDRPDVLTTFTTKITADKTKYPVLLSNGDLIASGNLNNNQHYATWHDPFKKPSYLFALVAGNLAHIEDKFITQSQKTISLRMYVEHKDIDKCFHAMDSLKKAMRWDEEEYGREYDLSTFMIVAVSDFNMGAMENKGLNIFNTKYVLATKDTATDTDYADIESVIAHEYFHNWTGNRVTCRDWFQLSLKEGLTVFRDQEFSRDMNSRDVNRIQDVNVLRNYQFPEDAGKMAHPVRPTSYQEVNNFYTSTIYNKGAEVIRMQYNLLGKSGFRKGMDLYFKRHDGCAVTIDDFVSAMEDANNIDLSQFKYWYDKAGTPVVYVNEDYKDGTLTLTLQQTCRKTEENEVIKPFHIPIKIALFTNEGKQIAIDKELIELKDFQQTFNFNNLPNKPIVSLLRDFSAPIILKREQTEDELQVLLKYECDGFAKWDAAQTLIKMNLIQCYNSEKNKYNLNDNLINTYKHVLTDEKQNNALRAEILSIPSFKDLANDIAEIDVNKAEEVRDFCRLELSKNLFNEARNLYDKLWEKEDNSIKNTAFGQRRLRNICLKLMFFASEQETILICQEQLNQAKNMTDKLACLNLLVNCKNIEIRNHTLQKFYDEYKHEDLVIDKWFAIQASAQIPNVLTNIKQLISHKDFKYTNPNRVRSLISSFTQNNPKYFHALDGSGYEFLTDVILTLDKINPQLSSSIATPFTRYLQLDKKYQTLIKKELNILAKEKLSKDLKELIDRSL